MSKLLQCVLGKYPNLDEDIANYVGSMLDDHESFESKEDVIEAIAPFLADAAEATEEEIDQLSDKLFSMMDTKTVNTAGADKNFYYGQDDSLKDEVVRTKKIPNLRPLELTLVYFCSNRTMRPFIRSGYYIAYTPMSVEFIC